MLIHIYGQKLEVQKMDVLVALVPKCRKDPLKGKKGAELWRAKHLLNMARSYEEAVKLIKEKA